MRNEVWAGPQAGAAGLIQLNTYIKLSTVERQNTTEKYKVCHRCGVGGIGFPLTAPRVQRQAPIVGSELWKRTLRQMI